LSLSEVICPTLSKVSPSTRSFWKRVFA
jgi:hypothetical protein